MSSRVSDSPNGLSDAAVTRLRALGRWPEFESGRYAVVEEIGRGGMGTVFLAIDDELGREVAIKIPERASEREPRAPAPQRGARPRAARTSRASSRSTTPAASPTAGSST